MQAICSIEYLGTNKGMDLDHVVGYIDWDKQMFLQGLVNQPLRMQRRPTRIDETDKTKTYLEARIPKAEQKKIHQWIIDLAAFFVKHDKNTINKKNYNKVYT